MTAIAIGTLFSGFGGVDIGAMAAGIQTAWGVEYDPAIAEVANANLGDHVRVANVLDCDPHGFDAVDMLHASPPCPNFSPAKAGGVETELDIAMAEKVAEFITVLRPRVFTLENVWAYRNSRSWFVIEDALNAAGYWSTVDHVNCADYGVPQTRMRMIARAVLGGFVPMLPMPQRWVGWYEAIEDLIATLPDSQFAPWQEKRLSEQTETMLFGVTGYEGKIDQVDQFSPAFTILSSHSAAKYRAFIVPGGNKNTPIRDEGEPVFTLISSASCTAGMRALLVDGQNSSGEIVIRDGERPSFTVTNLEMALEGPVPMGRVVAMMPRALARFQSFPDWYELPEKRSLAAKGIGNAVPPLLMQQIYEGLSA